MQRPLVCFYLPNSFYSSVHSVMLFDFFVYREGLFGFFGSVAQVFYFS